MTSHYTQNRGMLNMEVWLEAVATLPCQMAPSSMQFSIMAILLDGKKILKKGRQNKIWLSQELKMANLLFQMVGYLNYLHVHQCLTDTNP